MWGHLWKTTRTFLPPDITDMQTSGKKLYVEMSIDKCSTFFLAQLNYNKIILRVFLLCKTFKLRSKSENGLGLKVHFYLGVYVASINYWVPITFCLLVFDASINNLLYKTIDFHVFKNQNGQKICEGNKTIFACEFWCIHK